jgi:hypothetical protein
MQVTDWLNAAIADAERRGLAPLKPLLETLARSTAALRAAELELRRAADADGDPPPPQPPPPQQ